MSHEFIDHAVPLAGFRVPRAVLPVGHEFHSIREAYVLRNHLEEVHAKTVKSRVSRVVLFVVHHYVRSLLEPGILVHNIVGDRDAFISERWSQRR